MQWCNKCGMDKPDGEFYQNKRTGQWASRCKVCISWLAKRKAQILRQTPEGRALIHAKKLAQKENAKRASKRARLKYMTNPVHLPKIRARRALRRAIKSGRIIKPTVCPQCGETAVLHAHHDDYSKPLKVMWVCSTCHILEHHPDAVTAREFEA